MKALKLIPVCLAMSSPLISTGVTANEVEGFNFTGYARFGTAFQGSDELKVSTFGALNGNASGRLGNESNGGEFKFSRGFTSDQGAKWDLAVMFDNYSDSSWARGGEGGVKLKQSYASVTNFVSSQPELRVWAGRDFHQRVATDLNDYFWMTHDGQGAGLNNLDLGIGKLDFGGVGQVESDLVGDNGKYAVTSKLHDIQLFDGVGLTLYGNYGFASEKAKQQTYYKTKAYQLAGEVFYGDEHAVVRYSDNAKDSVFDLTKDEKAFLVSFDGKKDLTETVGIQYLAAYQSLDVAGNEDRVNYNAVIRPTYTWDDTNSTWLDVGYSVVDYKNIDAKNASWKVTLSQNISVNSQMAGNQMLRFYVTAGNADNEYTKFNSSTGNMESSKLNTFTVGAMAVISY